MHRRAHSGPALVAGKVVRDHPERGQGDRLLALCFAVLGDRLEQGARRPRRDSPSPGEHLQPLLRQLLERRDVAARPRVENVGTGQRNQRGEWRVIDRELQLVPLDRTPDRVAVEADEDGGPRAREDDWRIAFHTLDVLRNDLALVDSGQHAVEGDHPIVLRDRIGDLGDDLLHLRFVERREIRVGDLEHREIDQAFADRDFRARLGLQRPVHRG